MLKFDKKINTLNCAVPLLGPSHFLQSCLSLAEYIITYNSRLAPHDFCTNAFRSDTLVIYFPLFICVCLWGMCICIAYLYLMCIPCWLSMIFGLMCFRIKFDDIFPPFILAFCRQLAHINREQITMSMRTFLIFLFQFLLGHKFLLSSSPRSFRLQTYLFLQKSNVLVQIANCICPNLTKCI